jgi:hypothetical protein
VVISLVVGLLDPLHRAKSSLCIKPGVSVEGSRRPFTLAVALSQLKRDLLTGLTPCILTRTYTSSDSRIVIPDHAFVRNLVYLHVESRKLVRA